MQFFIDTANLEQIKKAKEFGLIDEVFDKRPAPADEVAAAA